MSSYGFIDLRQSSGTGSHTDDSVWPSFTDIMTVVVMIFLMALVGILLKNTELTGELESTIAREKEAATLAAQRNDESTTLRASIQRLTASLAALKVDKEVLVADKAALDKAYGELGQDYQSEQVRNQLQAKSIAATDAARLAMAVAQQAQQEKNAALTKSGRETAALLTDSEQQRLQQNQQINQLSKSLSASEAARRALAMSEVASQAQRQDLNSDLTDAKLKQTALVEKLELTETERDDLAGAGEQLARRLVSVRAELASSDTESQTLRETLENSNVETERLQEEFSQLQERLLALKKQQEVSAQQGLTTIETLQTEKQTLQVTVDRMNAELVTVKEQKDLSEQQGLTTIEALRSEKEKLQETVSDINAEMALERLELIESIQSAKQDIAAGQASLEKITSEKLQSEADRKRLTEQVDQLQVLLQDREIDTERLASELEFDRTRYQVLSDTVIDIGNEKLLLSTALAESRKRERALAIEKIRLNAEVSELGLEKTELAGIADQLENERTGLYDRLELDKEELAQLQLSYVDLKDRYDKLVGPARSPIGRIVVDIRHYRNGDVTVTELREPNWTGFREVSQVQLEQRLRKLASEHDNNLYTRIIFPEKSGLSYSEALRFETQILERYDYYQRATASRG